MDPTEVFQFGSGNVRRRKKSADDNEAETEEDEENFLPTVRVIDEVRSSVENLEIERVKLKLAFIDPPQQGNMSFEEYNTLLTDWLDRSFITVLRIAESRLSIAPLDRVGFKFKNGDQDNFSISFRPFNQYSSNVILSSIARVLQSNAEFLYNENLVVEITQIRMPSGNGRVYNLNGCSNEKFAKVHYRSVYSIKIEPQEVNLCLAYALVLGMAHSSGNKRLFDQLIYPPNLYLFSTMARDLCEDANVDLTNGGGVEHIQAFQNFFNAQQKVEDKYNIIVYADRRGKNILFTGMQKNPSIKKIFLLLDENHYFLIRSIQGAFCFGYYCEECLVGYSSIEAHKKCPYTCPQCYTKPPCKKTTTEIKCEKCNRYFRGTICFEKHKEKICAKYKICKYCFQGYRFNIKSKHKCGSRLCLKCKAVRPLNHQCYFPTIKIHEDDEDEEENIIFVFFDFETTQETESKSRDDAFEHKVNLCIAQQVCNDCLHLEDLSMDCKSCGKREHIFEGENALKTFMQYLPEQIPKKFKKVICIAHNLQSYDGHFCLRYMYQHNSKWSLDQESIIMNGSKIMKIKVARYLFLDSLNYLAAPLSKLPKMFNIPESKGWFWYVLYW